MMDDTLTYEQVLQQKVDRLQIELSLAQAENIVLTGRNERLLATLEDIHQQILQLLPRER